MSESELGGVLAMIFGAFLLGCGVGSWHSDNYWERTTIHRGLALYCPTSSDFAFVGECK